MKKKVIMATITFHGCDIKPMINVNISTCQTERRIYKRALIYHPSNSKKGFPIKGTNLRVSFEYI